MTLDQAIRRADRRAKTTGEIRFVVFSPDDLGSNGSDYHVCTDEETVTFFHLAPVVYCTADRHA